MSRKWKNQFFFITLFILSLLTITPFFFIIFHIIIKGIHCLSWEFFTEIPGPIGEKKVGILNAIIGTVILLSISCVIAIPWGIGVGTFLFHHRRNSGWFPQSIRLFVGVLQSTPSLVIGIVIYLWVVVPMKTFSVFAGSIALALIMMPIIVSSTEENLKLVPKDIQNVALSLAVPYYKTIFKILIPSASRGIISGIFIGLVRISGETAPLLLTLLGSPYLNWNLFRPMQSMPLLIFHYATSPYKQWHDIAWATALLLLFFLFIVNIFVKIFLEK